MTQSDNRYPRMLQTLAISVLALLVVAGCNLDDGDNGEQEPFITQMSTENHGTVLSDNSGNALYFFTLDVKGKSKCTGDCITNWPPVTLQSINTGNVLDIADFDTTHRSDGEIQTTYKGWPLYYFANDDQNTVNGDGVNDVWFVAKGNYSLMIADEQLVGADGNNYTSDYTQGEGITTYFTDSEGRTLYTFANDEFNTNNFTNEDFSNNAAWPIFHTEIDALPSSMDTNNFAVIDVHGEQQLTYKGWPLYYFGQDEAPGDTKGVSVPQPGVWPIVNSEVSEAPASSQ
ncbi:MAG: hypothetical protein U5K69_20765 [Balneolaceae bacterium]|nr:hypothetical protein [Balneolaceae bacterium]